MCIIPCRYDGASNYIINLVTQIRSFHPTELIMVVDSDSPDKSYFSKLISLKEMTNHIYGRVNVISRNDRPNMFVKELNIYIKYLQDRLDEAKASMTSKQEKYLLTFADHLKEGIAYYNQLFAELTDRFEGTRSTILSELEVSKAILNQLKLDIEDKSLALAMAY